MSKQTTASKILESARKLFNEQGVESVSVAQIADQIGISTGNLTYHFAKKKDMVAAHTKTLEDEILGILEDFPFAGSAEDFFGSHLALFKTIWQYRFLYNGTTYLIQNNLLDQEQFQALIDHVYSRVLQQCEYLIENKLMKPIPAPHDVNTLVDCIWWQWLGWLDANQLLPKDNDTSQEQLLENGFKHMLFLVQPYMHQQFIEQVYAEFHSFDTASV